MNLLAGDLVNKVSSINTVIEGVKSIVVQFKTSELKMGKLINEWDKYIKDEASKGNKVTRILLDIPGSTRWYGVTDMLFKFLRSKQILMKIIVDGEILQEFREQILSDTFWAKVEVVYKLMNPISKGIAILESDKSVISDVAVVFSKIDQNLDFSVLENEPEQVLAKRLISDRMDGNFISEAHYLALLLDPRYENIKYKCGKVKGQTPLTYFVPHAPPIFSSLSCT